MSIDTVDDLHTAEDFAGTAVLAARGLLAAVVASDVGEPWLQRLAEALSRLVQLGAAWDLYCRPSCTFLDTGECQSGDTCGCPCGHVKRCVKCHAGIDEPVLDPAEPERCAACGDEPPEEETPPAT